MELQLGGEAPPGAATRRARGCGSPGPQPRDAPAGSGRRPPPPAAPSPPRSREGRWVTAPRLLATGEGEGEKGDRASPAYLSRARYPPSPFLRSKSLKNSRRAKRLATGSAFPHLPPVLSPQSLNPRGRFRPGFPSSPPASARARASGGHFGDSLEADGPELCSPGASPPLSKSSPAPHFIGPPFHVRAHKQPWFIISLA